MWDERIGLKVWWPFTNVHTYIHTYIRTCKYRGMYLRRQFLNSFSDSDFEYCIWRHSDRLCEFEWKRSAGAVVKTVSGTRMTRLGEFSPIGRLLSLGSFFNYKRSWKFCGSFSPLKKICRYIFWPKLGWVAFWVIFSQTHLVTLVGPVDARGIYFWNSFLFH
jgi:hypothetical protein